MKRLTYTLILFIIYFSEVFSQDILTYTYDPSGNRTSRSHKTIPKKSKRQSEARMNLANMDSLSLMYNTKQNEISIFYSFNKKATFYLYNSSGKLLYVLPITANMENISMDNYPLGTYIASIKVCNKSRFLKFTKK